MTYSAIYILSQKQKPTGPLKKTCTTIRRKSIYNSSQMGPAWVLTQMYRANIYYWKIFIFYKPQNEHCISSARPSSHALPESQQISISKPALMVQLTNFYVSNCSFHQENTFQDAFVCCFAIDFHPSSSLRAVLDLIIACRL